MTCWPAYIPWPGESSMTNEEIEEMKKAFLKRHAKAIKKKAKDAEKVLKSKS